MKYRHLGKTGLKVSEIGFGAEWLQGKTLEESKELIDYCHSEGVNFLDCWMSEPNVRTNIGIAIKDTKPSTTKVNFMLYKNIITTNTKEKNKSIITDTDLFVIKSLIWSSSLTLAIILPTFLFSKYVKGRANKCVKSFAPSFASILLAV